MKMKTENILGVLIAIAVIVILVSFVFIIKLFTSPDVTVGGLPVFSEENIKNTAIMGGVAAVIAFIYMLAQGNNSDDK